MPDLAQDLRVCVCVGEWSPPSLVCCSNLKCGAALPAGCVAVAAAGLC